MLSGLRRLGDDHEGARRRAPTATSRRGSPSAACSPSCAPSWRRCPAHVRPRRRRTHEAVERPASARPPRAGALRVPPGAPRAASCGPTARPVGSSATSPRPTPTSAAIAPALAAHLDDASRARTPPRCSTSASRPAACWSPSGTAARTRSSTCRRQSGDEAELLRRAIATAAHEIRNPVSVLMGVAETLAIHGDELTEAEREPDARRHRSADPPARQHHRRPARRRAGPARHARRTAASRSTPPTSCARSSTTPST